MVANRRRKLYWLADNPTAHHRMRAKMLGKEGYEVEFFHRVEDLTARMQTRRVGTIVIGDEGPEDRVEHAIATLLSMPEAQGCYLVMSLSKSNSDLATYAACSAFRDMIPLGLDDKQWLNRFQFATGRVHVPFSTPYPQIAFNGIASASLPARLVWLGDDRLLFEAKVRPPRGATFQLTGPLTAALGVKSLTLTVEECRRTDLVYRFSEAILCRYKVPQAEQAKAERLLSKLRQSDFGPRHKVFAAVAGNDLRSDLVRALDPLRFELNIALQKHSIVNEPRYFGPNIVLIEDQLCLGTELERFQQMLDSLSPEIPVYIIGSNANLTAIQKLDPTRKIGQINRLPRRFGEDVIKRYLPPSSKRTNSVDPDAVSLPADHIYSICEVTCSARLKTLHPGFMQASIPFNIGTYGLCKIDSPMFKQTLGYAPYMKVTETYVNNRESSGNFTQTINGYLCNVDETGQQKIAAGLARFIAGHFQEKFLGDEPVAESPIAPPPQVAVGQDFDKAPPKPQHLKKAQKRGSVYYSDAEIYAGFSDRLIKTAASFMEQTYDVINSKNFRKSLLVVGIAVLALFTISWLSTYLVPYTQQSGEFYNEGLRKFAPSRFENSPPPADDTTPKPKRGLPSRFDKKRDKNAKPGWPFK